jgi:ADP-heptose:LPS heptosyltransferase
MIAMEADREPANNTPQVDRLARAPRRVLVFRCGQLGDMIMSLPAMWALRHHWPDASFTLLCNVHPGQGRVSGSDIFDGTGIFDAFEHYRVAGDGLGRLAALGERLRLLRRLRAGRYDGLVYLAPSIRTVGQVSRDRIFFRAAGIGRIYGATNFPTGPVKQPGRPFSRGLSEADLLLERLAADGIPTPGTGQGSLDLGLGDTERAEVARWRSRLGDDGGRLWLGLGPGSKMPAKRWPLARFEAVMAALIDRYDVWPVVFGGAEDRADGERLVARWARGFNAAGALSVRAAGTALKKCVMYLGNDTGTMHLAASVGVPCVALFSARDRPGTWYPYGVPQKVFRLALECEGCFLVECHERKNACLTAISIDQVVAGCEEMLKRWVAPLATIEA